MTNLLLHLHNYQTNQTYTGMQQHLAEEDIVQVTEQLERKAFERKHGDVHLKLSNMRNVFTDLFAGTTGTTRWGVHLILEDSVTFAWRTAWRGEIHNKSINFGLDSEWCEFDAFSKTKLFWERAKTLRNIFKVTDQAVWAGVETGLTGYIPLPTFLTTLETLLNLSSNATIFSGIDFTQYTGRRIRGVRPGPICVPAIGNEGRLVELDPEFTVAELLEAMQRYYNCEFYIDHHTRSLQMRRRNSVNAGTPRNIDAVLCDDVEPVVSWLDDSTVDYIYIYSYVFGPAPVFVEMYPVNFPPPQGGFNQLSPGLHRWRIVACTGTPGASASPLFVSAELAVDLPHRSGYTGWWVTISLPVFQSPVTDRWIYRLAPGDHSFRQLRYNTGNSTPFVWEDRIGIQLLAASPIMPSLQNTFNLYRRYNEVTGQWEPDIIDSGKNRPVASIHEVKPKLRFTEIGLPNIRPEDAYDVWSFFGQDTNFTTFSDEWIDWFRTKRRVTCKVKDVDYVLNNPVESSRFPNDLTPGVSYSVKRFTSKLMKEETELELLSM